MKTITITLQNDQDADQIMDYLCNQNKYQAPAEIFEMDENISDEDLEAFDRRMEEFYDQDFDEAAYLSFRQELIDRFGIYFALITP